MTPCYAEGFTLGRHGCRALCVARTAEGDFRLKGYLPVYYTNKETLTTLEVLKFIYNVNSIYNNTIYNCHNYNNIQHILVHVAGPSKVFVSNL